MLESLMVRPIRTNVFHQGDSLEDFITQHLSTDLLKEPCIVAVTSKIVSLAENQVIPKSEVASKMDLIRRESDVFLGEAAYGTALTIKQGLLIPSAGIDESNSESGGYLLYPKRPYATAAALGRQLRSLYRLEKVGIILTDSHTQPLRKGVTGIALAYWGFQPTRNLIGQADLFGRPLKMTLINIVDALATAAVLVMGESNEQSPIALIECPHIEFNETGDPASIRISLEEDLYQPLLKKSQH